MSESRRRIELIRTLGQGGFGSVYLADVHSRDDFVQRLAVKVLSQEMSEDADVAARQRDEARLLARLNHDHIVRVVDLTELDGRPAVLMEYVEGVDCAELLRRGALPIKASVQLCAAAASALDAAWSSPGLRGSQPLRVIHRDIKPANLLVSVHGGVKVLDFGIARGDFDREGRTGSVQFGTARFMAPEQWLYGEASNKVDVYALGVTLVEVSTGMHLERPPLEESAFQAHMQAVREAVVDPSWPRGFAADFDRLLGAMLAFRPEQRPDAGEVYETLAHLADQAPGEGLVRWARRSVPPILKILRERWDAVPPPRLGQPIPPPAPVEEPVVAPIAPAAGRTVLSRPQAPRDPSPPALADTLASRRPARAVPETLPGVLAGLSAAAVLAVGAVWGVPRVLERPEEAVAAAPVVEPEPPPSPPSADAALEEPAVPSDPGSASPAAIVTAGSGEAVAPEEGRRGASSAPKSGSAGGRTSTSTGAASKGNDGAGATSPAAAASTSPAPAPPAEAPSSSTSSSSSVSPGSATESPTAGSGSTGGNPSANLVAINLSSTPWGAEVVVDGRAVGRTPLRGLQLSAGPHTISMAGHGGSVTRSITVGGRNPSSHTWIVETNEWRSSQ